MFSCSAAKAEDGHAALSAEDTLWFVRGKAHGER